MVRGDECPVDDVDDGVDEVEVLEDLLDLVGVGGELEEVEDVFGGGELLVRHEEVVEDLDELLAGHLGLEERHVHVGAVVLGQPDDVHEQPDVHDPDEVPVLLLVLPEGRVQVLQVGPHLVLELLPHLRHARAS